MAAAIPCREVDGDQLRGGAGNVRVTKDQADTTRSLCEGLSGDLREMDFAMLLHRLHAEGASGVLMMENNKKAL